MSLWTLALIALALCGAATWYVYRILRERNIGYGMLVDHHRDGSVRIVARLERGPAGRAGIKGGAELVMYNDVLLCGLSVDVFRETFAKLAPKRVGEIARLLVCQGGKKKYIVMAAKVIWESIPDRSGYDPPPRDYDQDDTIQYGLAFCKKIGQFLTTRRLSDKAIDRVLILR